LLLALERFEDANEVDEAGEGARVVAGLGGDQPAPFFLVAELAPGIAVRGHGSIVSVSSMASGAGLVGGAVYGATKAALEAMKRAWAAEYSASGLRVNAIAPGPVYTPTPSGPEFIIGWPYCEQQTSLSAGAPLSDREELGVGQFRVNQEAERIQQLALLHQA
jgi:NAD(P)-dependent dehydrogenase (short-subunit alcohol dehydrogenase family)